MMKLYFGTGACSLAPHILLEASGHPYEAHQVNFATKTTKAGENFNSINPKSQVPTLKTDDGKTLTECAAILQFIADQHPEKNLLPKFGTWERYKANEWLNFIATELHKGLGLFFAVDRISTIPEGNTELRKNWTTHVGKKLDVLAQHLSQQPYILGSQFSAVDAYAFTILNWHHILKFDLTKWPALMGYLEKVKTHPAVQSALKHEGLL